MEFNEKYVLTDKNFHKESVQKHQIVLGNTHRNTIDKDGKADMSFFYSHTDRRNGFVKTAPHYSIDVFGEIYKHFPDDYWTSFTDSDIDSNILSIALQNEGFLLIDSFSGGHHNWCHEKYSRKTPTMFNKEWRSYYYWSSYSDKQYSSLSKLIFYLTNKHNIDKKLISHNTLVDGISKFQGTVSRSNYSNHFLDVSPAFDWSKIE